MILKSFLSCKKLGDLFSSPKSIPISILALRSSRYACEVMGWPLTTVLLLKVNDLGLVFHSDRVWKSESDQGNIKPSQIHYGMHQLNILFLMNFYINTELF